MEDIFVDYNVVSEFASHQTNQKVKLAEAAKNIFKQVKEKSMQMAFGSTFKTFDTIDELEQLLQTAVKEKYSITIYDEDYAG
jgi:hypothetical protein